ncbi:EF-hand calcium-binding domain-containing protein 14 isoform X1 [Dunckerocampus dactyliophorus]|uniref:EF-hand calcium-binding domain-containing protein 14 isoform X1 n=1 Tax=Dunckerocampus dactyliophorus TaxID=161453 RepID=UPI002405EF51|nr:EF-hand calcium-binding domain-containing protein 14 isoform X1 [Dunckerocampus dactyliophorus]
MKKRKELNALIGLGDSKRKKPKKGSGHRLLPTEPPDSESDSSSDNDGFNNMDSGAGFGKSYSQCCTVCYPLFLFIILVACVMACAGLIWMQIALKEDFDLMKERLHSMESSQKESSSELPKLSEDLKTEEKKLDDIESGDKGLGKLWSNLTEMNRKITLLDTAVNHLKVNLKSASDLISLPTTVEELQKSVATIGSTLTSVQHDVKTMQTAIESQKKSDDGLKATMDITDLRKAMSEANQTEVQHHTWTNEQIHILLSTVAELQHRVASLENGSKQTLKDAESHPLVSSSPQLSETSPDYSTLTPGPQTSRHPRFLTPSRSKRNADVKCQNRRLLPEIASLEGLEDIYGDVSPDSAGLTYEELLEKLGPSTPKARTLRCFDTDGDERYSLMELRAAVGV